MNGVVFRLNVLHLHWGGLSMRGTPGTVAVNPSLWKKAGPQLLYTKYLYILNV